MLGGLSRDPLGGMLQQTAILPVAVVLKNINVSKRPTFAAIAEKIEGAPALGIMPEGRSTSQFRKARTRGNVLVESAFIVVLLFGMIWLAWNLCWVLYAKSRLQLAVNEAARAAVTGQLQFAAADLRNTIAQVAEHTSPEFLTAHLACQTLHIDFFDQNGNASAAPVQLGVVRVSVQNYPYTLLTPIVDTKGSVAAVGSTGTANISVSASRVSQACNPLNCPPVGSWPPGTCP
jgi:Flp pilus assembly protein TadG